MAERINYVMTDTGIIVGNSVNLPFIVEAENLDELNTRMKELLKSHIDYLQSMLDSGSPFEFKQLPPIEWRNQK